MNSRKSHRGIIEEIVKDEDRFRAVLSAAANAGVTPAEGPTDGQVSSRSRYQRMKDLLRALEETAGTVPGTPDLARLQVICRTGARTPPATREAGHVARRAGPVSTAHGRPRACRASPSAGATMSATS